MTAFLAMSRPFGESHGRSQEQSTFPSLSPVTETDRHNYRLPPPHSRNALPRVTDTHPLDRGMRDRNDRGNFEVPHAVPYHTRKLPSVHQLLSSHPQQNFSSPQYSSGYVLTAHPTSSSSPSSHPRQHPGYEDDGPNRSYPYSRSGSASTFTTHHTDDLHRYSTHSTEIPPSGNHSDRSRLTSRSRNGTLPPGDLSPRPEKQSGKSSSLRHRLNEMHDSPPSSSPRAAILPQVVDERYVDGEGWCFIYADGTHCPKAIDGEPVNANWGITKAGKPRKRLAQACITCREKKIKCQPNLPKCDQCQKSGRECRFESAPRGNQATVKCSSSECQGTMRNKTNRNNHNNTRLSGTSSRSSLYSSSTRSTSSRSSASVTSSASQSPVLERRQFDIQPISSYPFGSEKFSKNTDILRITALCR